MAIKATTQWIEAQCNRSVTKLITMASKTLSNLKVLSSLLLVVAISALPTPDSSEDPAVDPIIDDDVTLATDLQPPPKPNDSELVFYVVNVYGSKNSSDESSEGNLDTDLIEKVPRLTGSKATTFVVIELDDSDEETDDPVDLDDLAFGLEIIEGFNVDKIEKNGETRLLKVTAYDSGDNDVESTKSKLEKIAKDRNKRSPSSVCKLSFKML
ncbi:uncharacterized protein LOC128876592 [Hylaeus volcanicus]|uniref:uncharacterized protein LOC128876592 n=1 Tax=Hylaeus volcanicus TaxID=313075 RepID=UPI0023B86157|nr:uncharacterized protein LOC128876592 [Hylaeus volcanicus]